MGKTLEELAIKEGMCLSEFIPIKVRELKYEKDLQEGRVTLKELYAYLGLECDEDELEIGEIRRYGAYL